jgi:molybdopterin converting factor small subunit
MNDTVQYFCKSIKVKMNLQVMVFGQLTDITGSGLIGVENISDTNSLLDSLKKKYPKLADTKFAIAVDKKVITENTNLNQASTVVLMPPFSGG